MKNNKKEMDVVFLLDRSGSMSNCVEDTIGGYNSYLKEQKEKGYNTKITTVLFDDQYEILHDRAPIQNVKNITNKEYYVRGCTALLDAIGKTINRIDKETKNNKVLFIITTDGLENASKEYHKQDIKKLIEKHPNWEFLYIGADIDSYEEGSMLGISRKNIANYKKGKEGVGRLFKSIAKASYCMQECDDLDASWKEDLEN